MQRTTPSIVDWPILEPEARDRLVNLPIWDIAMQTEGNASLRVLTYAETVADPLVREAIEMATVMLTMSMLFTTELKK